jgi:hypothetical protein
MPVPFPSPRLAPLLVLCCLLLLIGGCTRPNPDFCCTSESECASLGVSEVRTCSEGRVCDSNVCLAVQCETATECTAEAPYCANQVCKATCAGDGDCAGAELGPLCAEDGVCVGCKSNDDCGEAAPICSPTKRVCTPCRADADCASGVCLAADGRCAKAGELLYVSESGTDNGIEACTQVAPCRTVGTALARISSLRGVVRLLGDRYESTEEISIASKDVYLDGENTLLSRTGGGTLVRISGASNVTIEGIRIVDSPSDPIPLEMTSSGVVRLSQLDMTSANGTFALIRSGEVRITESKLVNGWIQCVSSSTVRFDRGSIQGGAIDGGEGCSAYVSRSVFSDARVTLSSGLVFTNNLYTSTSPTCTGNLSGGNGVQEINFNTFVCRHNPPISGPSLGFIFGCSTDEQPTGNIFAWDSMDPVLRCAVRQSIFPSFLTPVPGEDNIYTDISSVFVDYLNGDFHLSASSPARGAGKEFEGIDVDLEGNPRPNPKGSKPDIGAFEAP